jgi:hypothetical protein
VLEWLALHRDEWLEDGARERRRLKPIPPLE